MEMTGVSRFLSERRLPAIVVAVLSLTPSMADPQTVLSTMPDPRIEEATEFMMRFAERTGLTSEHSPQRYLWTDAFAVCNFLGLARATGQERYLQLALGLVDQVHHTLGQHRTDDPRTGWISGLSESEGMAHPTQGGLRIGKKLSERRPGEPFDERLEWDRDGQYFHYLTKWRHALDQTTRSTGRPTYTAWARQLAKTAYGAFTYATPWSVDRRMYWKMSIDLSHPLVPSMGQHDPLDGYITYVQLQTTASTATQSISEPNISSEASQLAAMIDLRNLTTADPLGIGGLLMDAARVKQLMRQRAFSGDDLLETLLTAALTGLEHYARLGDFREPATYRLAFRELGLSIGLHAVVLMRETAEEQPELFPKGSMVSTRLEALMHYAALRDELETFWRLPENQQVHTWLEHRDINEVMLATSLASEGCLILQPPP